MYETIEISEEEATIRRLMDSVFMKAAEDSGALDKIIKRIEEDDQCDIRTAHDAFELIHDIRKIIDERGD